MIGETLSFIPDILGFIFLGLGGNVLKEPRNIIRDKRISKPNATKKIKRGRLKFFLSFLGELTPFLGALPFWTFYVISESKKSYG